MTITPNAETEGSSQDKQETAEKKSEESSGSDDNAEGGGDGEGEEKKPDTPIKNKKPTDAGKTVSKPNTQVCPRETIPMFSLFFVRCCLCA